MSNIQIETDLKDILNKLDGKLDHLQKDVTDINLRLTKVETKLDSTVEDIKESFPSFERLFKEKWITSMENDFNSTIQTLTDKVHNFLSEFFEVRSGRETQIFFDIGMEVRLDNGTSLLIDPTKLLPIMVEKSRER